MSGSVTWPLTVEIAFGAAPMDTTLTWTDVSSWVIRSRSISLSRGWDAEASEPLAGRAQLRLKNDDGRFTPGNSGAFGLIRNKLPLRVRRGGTVLWTGVVEKWAMQFDGGQRPVVDVTCVDRWARLKARKITDERMQPLMVGQGATWLWPMTDESGADRLKDVQKAADLVPINGGGITAGAASNPQTGTATNVATVQTQAWPAGFSTGGSLTSWSVAGWINAGYLQLDNLFAPGYIAMTNAGGTTGHALTIEHSATVTKTATSTANNTSGWHHYALTASLAGGTTTYRWYVDGTQRWTDTATGTMSDTLYLIWAFAAGMSYVGVWNEKTLSAAEIAAQYDAAALTGWAGDTADVRAARIRAINGAWAITTQGTFTSTMSKPTLTDKSVADALLECAQAEAGALFIDAQGWPVIQSRTYRLGVAAAATIPARVLAADATWELDDQTLINVVTVDRMVTDTVAATVKRRNETSISAYDERSKSLQLWLDSDAQAVDRANAETNMFATPLPRSQSFTVDLATCQAAISESTVLGIGVGSRIIISGLPATSPPVSSSGWYVESIDDEISHTAWRRTFTVSPALDFFVLQDSTFGQLNAAYVLAF